MATQQPPTVKRSVVPAFIIAGLATGVFAAFGVILAQKHTRK